MSPYDSIFEALGDSTRRQIVELLRERPAAVGELADRLPVSRPAVSQHLKVLERAGLVTYTSAGTRHVYALRSDGLAELRAWLDAFWDGALGRFAVAAEHRADPDSFPTTPPVQRQVEEER